MNKIDYSTQPKEKGIDNFIWVHETKIKQAENEIEELKQELIEAINNNQFNKISHYNYCLNRLDTIVKESKNTLSLLRNNLKED